MCLFLFWLAGTWLAFYKPWLNLIQGQFSFQAWWGSQWAFKTIFTVTDHLERVAGKAEQEVTKYLFFQTSAFPIQVPTSFNKPLYVNISEAHSEFSVGREEDCPQHRHYFFGVVTCGEDDRSAVSRCFPSWLWAPVSGFPTPQTTCFPPLRLVLFCRINYKFIQEGLALWLHGSGTYHGAHSRTTSFESFHLFEEPGKELCSRLEHLVGDWEGKDLVEEGHELCFHVTPCPKIQTCISSASFLNVNRKDICKM